MVFFLSPERTVIKYYSSSNHYKIKLRTNVTYFHIIQKSSAEHQVALFIFKRKKKYTRKGKKENCLSNIRYI